MSTEPFIPYAKQSIDESDIHNVQEALKQELITRGPKVEEFEKIISNYCGASFAVAFNSGTSALFACCHAVNVNIEDRLLVSPNTFVASVGCGTAHQATPVFVDIDRSTGNFNLDHLSHNLHKTRSRGKKIVVAVHFAGLPVDMESLDRLITDPDTIVIEDAAHAIGSCYLNGQKVGCCSFSHMTMFSFHPAKTITTGEGGVVTTNDSQLYQRLKQYRNNGIEREQIFLKNEKALEGLSYYEVQDITGNFHMTEMQAALGISQFNRIEKFIQKRQQLVLYYRQLLKDIPHLKLFDDCKNIAHHLMVVQIDFKAFRKTRIEVMSKLKEKGIGSQVHYIPVYHHPYFIKTCGNISDYFPECEKYYAETLSLPLYYDLNEKDVERVVETLKKVL